MCDSAYHVNMFGNHHTIHEAYGQRRELNGKWVETNHSTGQVYQPPEYDQFTLRRSNHAPSAAYVSDEPLLPQYSPGKNYAPRRSVPVTTSEPSRISEYYNQYWVAPRDVAPGFFTDVNVKYLTAKINEALYGVKGPGIKADVSRQTVQSMMSSVYSTHQGRVEEMNDRVINTIVSTMKNEAEAEQWGNSLDPWVQQRTGEHGILSHPKIKINHRYRRVWTAMSY